MKGSFLPGHKHVPHGAHPESEERVQAHPSSGGPRELFYMFDNYKLKKKKGAMGEKEGEKQDMFK